MEEDSLLLPHTEFSMASIRSRTNSAETSGLPQQDISHNDGRMDHTQSLWSRVVSWIPNLRYLLVRHLPWLTIIVPLIIYVYLNIRYDNWLCCRANWASLSPQTPTAIASPLSTLSCVHYVRQFWPEYEELYRTMFCGSASVIFSYTCGFTASRAHWHACDHAHC